MGNPTYTYIFLTPTNDTYDISRSYTIPIPNHTDTPYAAGRPGNSGELYSNLHAGTERITTFFNYMLHRDKMPTSTRRKPKQ